MVEIDDIDDSDLERIREEEKEELPKVSASEIKVKAPYPDLNGVSPRVASKVQKALEKGRRYFGSSGASLTYQVNGVIKNEQLKADKAKIGLDGERETTKFLRDWMKDKPGVVLVDSVHINKDYKEHDTEDEMEEVLDEEEGVIDGKDTDHVLLIGDVVILVDTKRWKSKKRYAVNEHGSALRTNKNFPGGRIRMKNAIFLWRDYLDEDAVLIGIVFINSEETSVTRNYNWYKQSFRLVELDRMKEFLDEVWKNTCEDEDRKSINSSLVSQVVACAIKPDDDRKRVLNPQALKGFH